MVRYKVRYRDCLVEICVQPSLEREPSAGYAAFVRIKVETRTDAGEKGWADADHGSPIVRDNLDEALKDGLTRGTLFIDTLFGNTTRWDIS